MNKLQKILDDSTIPNAELSQVYTDFTLKYLSHWCSDADYVVGIQFLFGNIEARKNPENEYFVDRYILNWLRLAIRTPSIELSTIAVKAGNFLFSFGDGIVFGSKVPSIPEGFYAMRRDSVVKIPSTALNAFLPYAVLNEAIVSFDQNSNTVLEIPEGKRKNFIKHTSEIFNQIQLARALNITQTFTAPTRWQYSVNSKILRMSSPYHVAYIGAMENAID